MGLLSSSVAAGIAKQLRSGTCCPVDSDQQRAEQRLSFLGLGNQRIAVLNQALTNGLRSGLGFGVRVSVRV